MKARYNEKETEARPERKNMRPEAGSENFGIHAILGKNGVLKEKSGKTNNKIGYYFPLNDKNDKKWVEFFRCLGLLIVPNCGTM